MPDEPTAVAAVTGGVLVLDGLRVRRGDRLLPPVSLTATPGTAWLEYEQEGGRLLLHILDLRSEEEWQELVRDRYEALLMEIFE